MIEQKKKIRQRHVYIVSYTVYEFQCTILIVSLDIIYFHQNHCVHNQLFAFVFIGGAAVVVNDILRAIDALPLAMTVSTLIYVHIDNVTAEMIFPLNQLQTFNGFPFLN